MPIYSYCCKKCSQTFEMFFNYSNYKDKPKCEICGSKDTDRQITLDAATINGSVKKSDSELKIGDLANRNRDKLSQDEKADFLSRYKIQDEVVQIPEISRFDPVAQAIILKPGEICSILRPSKTAITSMFYRICI